MQKFARIAELSTKVAGVLFVLTLYNKPVDSLFVKGEGVTNRSRKICDVSRGGRTLPHRVSGYHPVIPWKFFET